MYWRGGAGAALERCAAELPWRPVMLPVAETVQVWTPYWLSEASWVREQSEGEIVVDDVQSRSWRCQFDNGVGESYAPPYNAAKAWAHLEVAKHN